MKGAKIMRILMSGFEPFGGQERNPSWEAVALLPKEIEGAEICRCQLPVVFGRAAEVLLDEVRKLHPEIIIMVGVAQGRKAVTPEKIAVNYQDARIPDNAGQTMHACPIDPNGADGIFTRLNAEAMVEAVKAAGLPCQLSLTAGAYVCNDLFYRVSSAQEALGYRCIFVHVPGLDILIPQQDAQALEAMVRAVVLEAKD